MKRRMILRSALFLSMVVFLASCAKSKQKEVSTKSGAKSEKKLLTRPFPYSADREGEILKGGTCVIGVIYNTPWKCEFNDFLNADDVTSNVMRPMHGTFIKSGLNQEVVDGGMCNVSFDKERKVSTMKIHPKATWSDGVAVTADDLIYCYECICHPDYDGLRYDDDFKNIIGAEDFHAGKAKNISGLKKIDDKTLEVHFKSYMPSMLWGAGLVSNPEPKHYLKDIPVDKLRTHERVRKHPLACGPFVMSAMVEGDVVEYMPNPYYCFDKPILDKIIMKRIAPTSAVAALKSGEVDLISVMSSTIDQLVEFDDEGKFVRDENGKIKTKVDNVDFISSFDNVYSYIAFKFGKWNKEKEEVEMDENSKFKDKALRKAIAYAADTDGVNETFYHGMTITPNSFITPWHKDIYDPANTGYSYNPEKAKALLDEAGYKDIDGDGFRETPDGKPLHINYLAMSGSQVSEPVAYYFIQNWKDVGLNVSLNDGRLLEFNSFYDKVEKDDPDVEMYCAAWSVASDPNPRGLYGSASRMNLERWYNAKNDELLDVIESEAAFDNEKLLKAYKAWDENMMEEVPCFPFQYYLKLQAVNKRMKHYDLDPESNFSYEHMAFVRAEPYVNTMK